MCVWCMRCVLYLVEIKCRVWFNSPGEDVSDGKWLCSNTGCYTISEITDRIRHHPVTHLIVEDKIPQNFHSLFSQLTHLRLSNVKLDAIFFSR